MKDTTVQFVCFVTKARPGQFIPEWEPYARKLQHKKQEPHLLELSSDVKNRYHYISQHEWPDGDFNFSFMTKSRSEHFPDLDVQVVQLGGYMPQVPRKKYTEAGDDVKLVAFVGHNDTDIDFYRNLSQLRHIVIYEAFYESCTYGHILELSIPGSQADELLKLIEKRPGVTAASYRACAVTA